MAARRVQRNIERTPEQLAELKAERERFQRERPTEEDLIASGEYDGPFRHGDVMSLLSALAAIKQEREQKGLSLAEVSNRSGLDKGMLSRLETGKIRNPTMHTLWKYARAVDVTLTVSVEKANTVHTSPESITTTTSSSPSAVAPTPRTH
jgi:ribosome-binding protein aMBF1 (putative translation factor)